jgi:hypothetical protein
MESRDIENIDISIYLYDPPRLRLIAVTAPTFVNPIVERERGKMELELRSFGLQGVGMPPDGSCFLHCLIYELFPLKWNCFEQYPSHMSMVNVGAADGVAPRRMEAAAMLRKEISTFGKMHVRPLSAFLHTPEDELAQRYITIDHCLSIDASNDVSLDRSKYHLSISLTLLL